MVHKCRVTERAWFPNRSQSSITIIVRVVCPFRYTRKETVAKKDQKGNFYIDFRTQWGSRGTGSSGRRPQHNSKFPSTSSVRSRSKIETREFPRTSVDLGDLGRLGLREDLTPGTWTRLPRSGTDVQRRRFHVGVPYT